MVDAVTADDVDDSSEPPEGKLAPAAVNNKDDAHDKTNKDNNKLYTKGKSQTPKVGMRETVD